MIAIVTDKPNVGREIARVLGADRKENGYMSGNGYMVTWTYGNMLSLAMPKDTGTAWVERENFPAAASFSDGTACKDGHGIEDSDINAVLQLKVIAGVFDACDTIVAATDASREGEMLFRYLYRFLGCRKPCLRLWISSLTDEAIAKGMENVVPCGAVRQLVFGGRQPQQGRLASWSQFELCRLQGGRFREQLAWKGTDPCIGSDKRTVQGKGKSHSRRQLARIRQPLQERENNKDAACGRFLQPPGCPGTLRGLQGGRICPYHGGQQPD